MEYGYLAVEGLHDVECVGRLLRSFSLNRVVIHSKLDPYWKPLIPTRFPQDDNLVKRISVPTFFQSDKHSIAVHACSGLARLPTTFSGTFMLLQQSPPLAMGLIADADDHEEGAKGRFDDLIRALIPSAASLFPDQPGQVSSSTPKTGLFIFPNNRDNGTFEDLLLPCAEQVYPHQFHHLKNCLEQLPRDGLTAKELEEINKPAGLGKTIAGSIANIFKPGKSIQVSIQDNRWINEETIREVTGLNHLQRFLIDLLHLSTG